MALKNCPECNKEVSSDAGTCPNCGKQLKPKEMSGCATVVVFIIMLAVTFPLWSRLASCMGLS